MNNKSTTLFFFFLLTYSIYAQEKTVVLEGKITDGKNAVANVHIYNISKSRGTISNDIGSFEILASLNDTIYVSSLQYEKQQFVISKKNIEFKLLLINLKQSVNQLDEVFLRHLTGDLNFDIANKPKDTIPIMGYVYNKKDLYKSSFTDQTDASNRPDPKANTDPIGGGAGIGLPDKKYQALLKLKRELKQKKNFPDLLKHDLGIEYFTVTLKIPKDKINNFISYCEYKNIVYKYHHNKQLEVIEILKEESIKYNAIKN